MPKKDDTIEPINASLDDVASALIQQAAIKINNNKELSGNKSLQQAAPQQYILDLGIEVQKDVNGIEMGVLENGIAYLTQRGLSLISGVSRSVIQAITAEWEEHYYDEILGKDRISFLKEYLFKNGYTDVKLYIETKKDGSSHYAYPDIVCMAILEYYAFESKSANETATGNYRKFAAYGLHKFIYDSLNYTPGDKWKYFHDRVSLLQNSVPLGFYSIFHEINGMIVDLINADLVVNDKTLPDISVGRCWGDYWNNKELNKAHGERQHYDHNYPKYYPQALSNPQKPWAYPESSIVAFREWFRNEYLPTKFPKYILTKAHLLGGQKKALEIADLYKPKQLEE